MLLDICQSLVNQINTCKTWRPRITVQGQPLHGSNGSFDLVDFIGLGILVPDPTFPKDSTFRFAGFGGRESEKNIIQYLVTSAMNGGTDLNVGQSYNNEGS
jgi:hypothetical protein